MSTSTPLTSKERKELRGKAHHLKPIVLIGKSGLSEAIVSEVNDSLEHHELIKVKFGDFKDQRKELSEQLATTCSAQIAGVVGNICILYRKRKEEEKAA
jgi:RNA-binding protein